MNITEFNSLLLMSSKDNLVSFEQESGKDQVIKIPGPNLPSNLTKGQLEVLGKEERTLTSVATFEDKLVAVATENKQIVVFDRDFNVVKNFIVNRTASKVLFTKCGDILVADRTGDVYLYQNSEPILLLGHLSMILDMVLTKCGKYIITCDRDEKIRVSRFPNAYNIVSFCLGHEEFVTKLEIVENVLLSSSGDGTVRIWDYLNGQELSKINLSANADQQLLKQFSEQMDREKVDVTALPVINIQTKANNNCFILAASLYNCTNIQIYKIDLNSFSHELIRTVATSENHHFYLTNETLYVFNKIQVTLYTPDEFSLQNADPKFENFYKTHQHLVKLDNSGITVLYKRKFDNVQEYLERKKIRLETKK